MAPIDGAIIAAVDIHGRDRLARPLMCVLFLVLARPLAAQPAAPTPSFQDLRAELAAKISAAGATMVAISCEQNLRERACVAVIAKDGAHDFIAVSRPLRPERVDGLSRSPRDAALALDARPLFAQRTPILDVAPAPDGKRLIVLEPIAVSIRQWTASGEVSDVVESRPIQTLRAWPRDLRGRLNATHTPFDVFLPGVTCRADLDPLRVSCSDESAPWPGLPNAGVEAARNYFTMPEGRTFVSAAAIAPVGTDTNARWLVADAQGTLTLVDEKRSPIAKLTTTGDDLASVRASCTPGPFVVVSNRVAHEPGNNDVDELRLFRVAGLELVLSAAPLRLPGTLTALWSGGSAATAIVHDIAADRYEAFQISVSCAR